jgi:hypothetical protein
MRTSAQPLTTESLAPSHAFTRQKIKAALLGLAGQPPKRARLSQDPTGPRPRVSHAAQTA